MRRIGILLILAGSIVAAAAYGQLDDPKGNCQKQPNGACVLNDWAGPIPSQQEPYRNSKPDLILQPSLDEFMYCSSNAVRGTRNVFVSDVFRSDQDVNTVAGEFEAFEDAQGAPTYFVCHRGTYVAMQQSMQRAVGNFTGHGYSVLRIRR